MRGAEVRRRVNVDSKGKKQTTALLVLYTDNDYFPLTYNNTLLEKERIAEQVNQFLRNSQDTSLIETVEEVHIGKWIISSIIGIFGLVAILSDEVTWIFNKATGEVQSIKRGIRGIRANNYAINQISGIQFEQRQRKNKEGKLITDYRLNLVLYSGSCLPVSDFTNNINTLEVFASSIKQFLNL
ncbi:hypothetical protein [Nostoc sp. FACHB-857]|uniref:hypothetical protein n=1 Tax=Nostoc sp. FACHB-857 TaxID=2692840 RepID=UPI0016875FFF|nr:hypothetical protein [Nostoc sp. FACHB-857]